MTRESLKGTVDNWKSSVRDNAQFQISAHKKTHRKHMSLCVGHAWPTHKGPTNKARASHFASLRRNDLCSKAAHGQQPPRPLCVGHAWPTHKGSSCGQCFLCAEVLVAKARLYANPIGLYAGNGMARVGFLGSGGSRLKGNPMNLNLIF